MGMQLMSRVVRPDRDKALFSSTRVWSRDFLTRKTSRRFCLSCCRKESGRGAHTRGVRQRMHTKKDDKITEAFAVAMLAWSLTCSDLVFFEYPV